MRIAVVGGGAAGLVAAYLLDGPHEVVVFEKEAMLGGHIRTLGRNVPAPEGLPDGAQLDAGVIELSPEFFPMVHRLFEDLEVELGELPGRTTFFRPGKPRLYPLDTALAAELGPGSRLANFGRMLPLLRQRGRFTGRHGDLAPEELRERSLGDLLESGPFGDWVALLTMYAYSIPYPQALEVPAALAVPMLRDFLHAERWTSVVGGTYRYVEALLERFGGVVHTGAPVVSLRRSETGVVLATPDRGEQAFDACVFAAPPDQLLAVLEDPTDDERRRFGAWRANHARTVVHDDRGPYERRGERYACEFDLFLLEDGRGAYNALLDRLEGLPTDDEQQFGLAFGLEDELDPARILHVQEHHTPAYTVDALRWRDEVLETNGQGRIWHVGAWLGDGLHEGAIRSANAVSEALGGRTL